MSLDVKDAVGVTKTLKTTLASGEHIPHHQIDGNVTVSGPLTNDQLRALAVPVTLDSNSLTALENIQVTFPSTQNVSVQNASLAVTDNGGSLTVDGTITAAQATAANLNATVVGSGSFTAAQSTASNLKAQAQLLNASGSVVDYAMTGTAGTPASDVVTIQGIVGGTTVPVSLASVPSHPVTGPLTNTELRTSAVPVSGTVTSRIADGAGNNLTSASRGSERALSVQIVDASGAQVTSFGGGGGGTVTATQTTPSSLKAQAQILDATGSQMSFVNAGIAGTPSVDVLTVQGSTSGTPIPVRLSQLLTGTSANTFGFNATSSTTLANADGSRKALTIFNEGSGFLYIKTQAYGGDTVSASNYQRRMAAGEYWEVPTAQVTLTHLGIIAGSGAARITTVT